MGLLRNTVSRRFSVLTRIADLALVGGLVLRFANRRGLISDETAAKLGAPSSPGGTGVSISEMALVGAAALRLIKAAKSRARR
ncbi:MAG: hypothetical protein HKN03_15515 [Acidimicrobiales bacterium]|nr:hypothetical protein [Acidimicrobiales bacterium]